MAKWTLWCKIETERSAKSASTKNSKLLCKSTCYAITNVEFTSSRILCLLSPNRYTSNSDIAGAMAPWMLSKRTLHSIHIMTSFSNQAAAMDRIACTEDFFKYIKMLVTPCRKSFSRSIPVAVLLRVGPSMR